MSRVRYPRWGVIDEEGDIMDAYVSHSAAVSVASRNGWTVERVWVTFMDTESETPR